VLAIKVAETKRKRIKTLNEKELKIPYLELKQPIKT